LGCPHQAGTATRSAPGGSGGLWGLRRYDSGMSGSTSGVTTALIAGGFAVGGAVIGFCGSAWNMRASLRASREAAHDQRLWDRRSAIYEEVLRTLDSFVPSPAADGPLRLTQCLTPLAPAMELYAS
jgi:hypothetical protein